MFVSTFLLTFAYESLLNETPEHVTAVMTVGGLVEGFLTEAMTVSGLLVPGIIGHTFGCSHDGLEN